MRYTPEHKMETHDRIVGKAAEEFRRCGLDGIGIATLMKELGLTHGGFYAHFETKDDLIAEASVVILDQSMTRLVAAAEAAPPGGRVQAIIDVYLSPLHRDNPGLGCILPALASDLARRPEAVRQGYTSRLATVLERIAPFMPANTPEDRRDQAIALLSAMAGTILIARSVADSGLSDRILAATRRMLSEIYRG